MKSFFTCLVLLLSVIMSKAGDSSPATAEIKSKEHPMTNGKFMLHIQVSFKKDAVLSGNPTLQLPSGCQAQLVNTSPAHKNCKKNSKMQYVFQVTYPKTSLPFYPKPVVFTQAVEGETEHGIYAEGRLYFTPYGTIEVFNMNDFYSSKRTWINEGSYIDTTRRYIAKNKIPKSDLS
ncbi:MAG: hypothetical protein K2X86_09125 [Cytophagaceae bacterium]|nr:hypothetical protein [Cytophagaceae bacterium]